MKDDLLSRLAPDAKDLIKEAMIGAVARMGLQGMSRAGKVLVKNPMVSATAAGAGYDMTKSVGRMNDLTTGAKNLMNSKMTAPANM